MIRRYLADCREGARILATRDFWRTFRDYWSADSVADRLGAWLDRRKREDDWRF